jgi:hypothetical protein
MNKIIDKVTFRFLLEQFVAVYLKEYGEAKSIEISKNVHNSNKVKDFINRASVAKIQPKVDDYLRAIHSILHFTFSKAETISVACTMLLCKWETDVGVPYGLSNDIYLNTIFFEILDKCDRHKTHISSEPNFFEKVHRKINPAIQEVEDTDREDFDYTIIKKEYLLNTLTLCNTEFKKISPLLEENIFL